MYKFSHQFTLDEKYANPLIEITTSDETTLPEMLKLLESFLRASGYIFDGALDIIENEQEEKDESDERI